MTGPQPSPPYCGDPPMKFRRLFQRDQSGGVPALFASRRVTWSFNARVAIRSACEVLGLQPGDQILVPAYNCGSEVDPLVHAGLEVRLYPVGRDTVISPEIVSAMITPKTKAVYVTNYFGIEQPNLVGLRALCDANGLRMIEDCALSLLSGKRPVAGRTGDVAVFCLYKFFPVLAGGALVTNAPDLDAPARLDRSPPGKMIAKRLIRMALTVAMGEGRSQSALRKLRGESDGDTAANGPVHPRTGMADMPGHYYFDPQLKDTRISTFAARPVRSFDVTQAIAARRDNWHLYRDRLEGIVGATMLIPEMPDDACPLNMPVLVENRDRVAAQLQAKGIGVTPWWAGYNANVDWTGQDDAIFLKDNVLSLPAHQFLGAEHVDYIVKELQAALR